ncbi:hypothetical protein SHI21_05440 [Bacteriovorax sp. PP10]|uniref:Uncharacterized protein n=1 Tax=Bacteriovorax antarcticus TaxID=3088717 RepID=A0ABU5VRG1_9BACT|nr:hypothetical protein [Bacteriovorax sp. PP10]MEA9355629.1 hypothetical protein [Bacteriovorax sp. PP10]
MKSGLILFCLLVNTYATAKPIPKLQVGGSYYQRIVQVKDVIADVLPPPVYIVESYLMSFLILNQAEKAMSDKKIDANEMQSIDHLIEQLRELKEGISENAEVEGYFSRVKIWNADLDDSDETLKKLKELMTKTNVASVTEFYKIFETRFIPAIKQGDIALAEKYQTELHEIFSRHCKIVDEIVGIAKKRIAELELQANKEGVDAKVKGPLYNNIMLMKDLIADTLPPPSFIIEPYLLAWEMIYETGRSGAKGTNLKTMLEKSSRLKEAYLARHDYWVKNLKIKILRQAMVEDSYSPAENFYKIYEKDFIPALEKSDVALAKKIMNERLTPLYEKHRQVVDKLVLAADKQGIEIESEMALQLAKNR